MPDFAQLLSDYLRDFSILALPLLAALTFHEVAHGYVAYLLGDPTAKQAGRLTLNPFRHLDPLGTLAFLLTRLIGWAKPVPVDARYFRNPAKGMMLVALAGPMANFVTAVLFALAFRYLAGVEVTDPESAWVDILLPLALISQAGVFINLALGFFNLIPIPPLDGSNVVAGFLPRSMAARYLSWGRYGFVILVILAMTGLFGKIIGPLVRAGSDLLL